MSKQNSYPFIAIWGQQLGSFQSYIQDEIRRAQEDGAPWNAIYQSSGDPDHQAGEWVTVDDISGDDRKLAMYRRAANTAYNNGDK